MKRHKGRAFTKEERKRLGGIMTMDEICGVCGAIRWEPFARGKNGYWVKDGERKPYCNGKDR